MHDSSQSLPTPDEVLICTTDTTAEEVSINLYMSLKSQNSVQSCLAGVPWYATKAYWNFEVTKCFFFVVVVVLFCFVVVVVFRYILRRGFKIVEHFRRRVGLVIMLVRHTIQRSIIVLLVSANLLCSYTRHFGLKYSIQNDYKFL